ncbi:MAG: hypothetical protein D6776_09980, partial [Planctomycetota bacterium]
MKTHFRHTRFLSFMSLAALCATLAACGGGGSGSTRLIGSGSTGGGSNTGSGAPSGLTATATSSTEIALQWTDNATDEDGFRLERRSQRLPWSTVAQLPADTTSYTDSALSPNTAYTYRVTATRGSADLGTSNEASATTLAPTNTCTEWTLSNGSTDEDRVQGVAYDPARDRLYVVGTTQGALAGPRIGGRDAFLQAYDATGKLLWQTQFGSSLDDWATAVAIDRAGNVYVAGFTDDKVAGQSAGARDAFVHRFPPSGGRPNWTGHYGTGRDDHASCVAVSPQGKVVLGGTSRNPGIGNEQDPWLAQFDPGAGANPVWTWKSGNGFFNENLVDLAIDPNNGDVYAIGRTQVVMPHVVGSPPNANNVWAVGDIYVARVDATGTEKWIVQIGSGCGMGAQSRFKGTGGDIPGGVAVSETGEIYVTGFA